MAISEAETKLFDLIQKAEQARLDHIKTVKMFDYDQALLADDIKDVLVEVTNTNYIERLSPFIANMKFLQTLLDERIKEIMENC